MSVRSRQALSITCVSLIHLDGQFMVQKRGFFQLVINMRGHMKVEVDGSVRHNAVYGNSSGEMYIPLHLDKGWHSLTMDFSPEGPPRIRVLLNGDQVAKILSGDMLRHKIHH